MTTTTNSSSPAAGGPAWRPLPAVLNGHAGRDGDRPGLSFVDYSREPGGSWSTLTLADIDRRARALATALENSFPRGERVAVLCPQGIEYVLGFLACLYAGMIAVPLFPPEDPRRVGQLTAMLSHADPACLLTTAPEASACRQLSDGRVPVWLVEEADPTLASGWAARSATPAEPAYLQYTSGSTRTPSAAVITHGNLVASALQCLEGYGCSAETPFAGWLPLFHDMGLALGVFMPMMAGAHSALMSPQAFIRQPARWPGLLAAQRAYISGGPNFAYDLCVRKSGDPDGLDLSGVGVLINGGEPVRAGTLRRFAETYAGSGLRAHALNPSYGMAEATVMVSCTPPGERCGELRLDSEALTAGAVRIVAAPDAASCRTTTVVGCGRPVRQFLRVTDPGTCVEREPGEVGEIWVRGPNVAAGYWRQPALSADVFDGALKTADGVERGWLRTGDLGFLHEGELFVLSRIKDVIIVNGTNHAPADIEDTVRRTLPEAAPGGIAAFAVPGDEEHDERLVVTVELVAGPQTADDIGLLRRVRHAVSARHGLHASAVVPVRRGTLPRTTSGKIRRRACRDLYLAELACHPESEVSR